MPLSSISTSPMPLSWTICTISRMRSARDWSTPLAIVSSRVCRLRMFWRSFSASSPKSAIRTSSSSLAARPSASWRTSSADGGSSASGTSSLTRATARATVASIALGGAP